METFPETANVDYRLSFADQGKQTFVLRLRQTNGSCRFPLVPFRILLARLRAAGKEVVLYLVARNTL